MLSSVRSLAPDIVLASKRRHLQSKSLYTRASKC